MKFKIINHSGLKSILVALFILAQVYRFILRLKKARYRTATCI